MLAEAEAESILWLAQFNKLTKKLMELAPSWREKGRGWIFNNGEIIYLIGLILLGKTLTKRG